jgi:hypothetical protein
VYDGVKAPLGERLGAVRAEHNEMLRLSATSVLCARVLRGRLGSMAG